jgi:hypothetical protein
MVGPEILIHNELAGLSNLLRIWDRYVHPWSFLFWAVAEVHLLLDWDRGI